MPVDSRSENIIFINHFQGRPINSAGISAYFKKVSLQVSQTRDWKGLTLKFSRLDFDQNPTQIKDECSLLVNYSLTSSVLTVQ